MTLHDHHDLVVSWDAPLCRDDDDLVRDAGDTTALGRASPWSASMSRRDRRVAEAGDWTVDVLERLAGESTSDDWRFFELAGVVEATRGLATVVFLAVDRVGVRLRLRFRAGVDFLAVEVLGAGFFAVDFLVLPFGRPRVDGVFDGVLDGVFDVVGVLDALGVLEPEGLFASTVLAIFSLVSVSRSDSLFLIRLSLRREAVAVFVF